MKKIIMGLCLLSATALVCANVNAMDPVKVPLKVRAEFHHEYKHVSNVNWTTKEGRYVVDFRKDGKEDMEARYGGTGHRIDTREQIAQTSMPEKAVGHLQEKYGDTYTHKYTKINRPWKRDLYMVKVKDSGKNFPVYVDKDGHEHDYSGQ